MLHPDSIAFFFTLKHELPGVEFKGRGKGRDNPLFGKVVRAAMAMANRRGGGTVIIGVEETQTGFNFVGLTPEQLATWKYESIAGGFNSFTNVPIEFDRQTYEHEGNTYLILDIHEFASVPVMCMKEYRDRSNDKMPESECKVILRLGAFYIRTLNKPESKEMLTGEEARTLFELVEDKAIQGFVTRTKLAGINIAPMPEDKEKFAHQLQWWNSPLLKEIRSRGYWDIRIRPVTFTEEQLPLSALYPLLMRASLNYRGWEFPYITAQLPHTGNDWIGFEIQEQWAFQAWRFFQSGQFAVEVGFLDDWENLIPQLAKEDWTPGKFLSALDVVFRLTEVFGLASRLAITDVYRDERSVVVDYSLRGVQDRILHDRGALSKRVPIFGYKTAAGSISHTVTLAKEDVIGRPQQLALEEAQYVFERFGWHPSTQLLASIQSEINIHS